METTMLHVRVDKDLKSEATRHLAKVGLTMSDAVRVLLNNIVHEEGLPIALTAGSASYDAWFRAKVQEALDDPSEGIPHEVVMDEVQALINAKRP